MIQKHWGGEDVLCTFARCAFYMVSQGYLATGQFKAVMTQKYRGAPEVKMYVQKLPAQLAVFGWHTSSLQLLLVQRLLVQRSHNGNKTKDFR